METGLERGRPKVVGFSLCLPGVPKLSLLRTWKEASGGGQSDRDAVLLPVETSQEERKGEEEEIQDQRGRLNSLDEEEELGMMDDLAKNVIFSPVYRKRYGRGGAEAWGCVWSGRGGWWWCTGMGAGFPNRGPCIHWIARKQRCGQQGSVHWALGLHWDCRSPDGGHH